MSLHDYEVTLRQRKKDRLEQIATQIMAGFFAGTAHASSSQYLAETSIKAAKVLIKELDAVELTPVNPMEEK